MTRWQLTTRVSLVKGLNPTSHDTRLTTAMQHLCTFHPKAWPGFHQTMSPASPLVNSSEPFFAALASRPREPRGAAGGDGQADKR